MKNQVLSVVAERMLADAKGEYQHPREALAWWTYSGGMDGVTLNRHASEDAALAHYSQMRALGGPRSIGHTKRAASEAEVVKRLKTTFGRVTLLDLSK